MLQQFTRAFCVCALSVATLLSVGIQDLHFLFVKHAEHEHCENHLHEKDEHGHCDICHHDVLLFSDTSKPVSRHIQVVHLQQLFTQPTSQISEAWYEITLLRGPPYGLSV